MNASNSILIVDDQQDFANMLADTLSEHDWQAHVAFNGSDALQMVEQYRPRVVLLDIAMLHMSGYDVAMELHARYGSECPALIAHTAWADNDLVRMQASLAGFESFLVKPASLERVLSAINRQSREPFRH
ncbi:MAG TPA: response regulator [Pseudoduganella sp.]